MASFWRTAWLVAALPLLLWRPGWAQIALPAGPGPQDLGPTLIQESSGAAISSAAISELPRALVDQEQLLLGAQRVVQALLPGQDPGALPVRLQGDASNSRSVALGAVQPLPSKWVRSEPALPSGRASPSQLSPGTLAKVAWARLAHSQLGFAVQEVAAILEALGARLRPRPRSVLLYSGQFDPFHKTHRGELLGAQALGSFDRTIVAPAMGGSPEERGPAWLRLLVAQRSLEQEPRVRVDSMVLRRQIQGASATVKAYQKRLGARARISFLMGSDNFRDLGSWPGVRSLLDNADLIVNLRSEYPLAEDPMNHLPEELRQEYRAEGPGKYVSARTGRTIVLVRIPTGEATSHQAHLAVHARDGAGLREVLDPAAAELVERYHYPGLDLAASDRRYAAVQGSRPIFRRILGNEAGDAVLRDWEALESLFCVPPEDPESTARVAELAYRAVRGSAGSLERFPLLYSQAVRLALDPGFADVRRNGCTRPRSPNPAPLRSAPALAGLFVKPGSGLLSKIQGAAIMRMVVIERDVSPLAHAFQGQERIRVYVGIDGPFGSEPDRIRSEGLLSHYAVRHGRSGAEARVAREGLRTLVIEHLRGNYRQSVFVASTLSPRVADAYAGQGGTVVVAEVPLSAVVFAGDPQVWVGTVFARSGNPNDYLHEAILREIRPEWIVAVRPARASGWRPSAAEKLRAVSETLTRPVLERLKTGPP